MIIQIRRKTGRILLLLGILAICGLAYLGIHKAGVLKNTVTDTGVPDPDSESSEESLQAAEESSAIEEEPPVLAVHVSGAVQHPDQVYYLPQGSRISDAIQKAGGPAEGSDLSGINLASLLSDGQKVYIPFEGEEPVMVTEESSAAVLIGEPGSGLTNINFATTIELEALPGIGEKYAQRIIEYRTQNGPFQSIEEIKNVKGIGEAVFAKIRDSITV